MDNIQLFNSIVSNMSELYANKNHDYGDSFEHTADEFGLIAPAIRLSDKLNRFKSLIGKKSNVAEEKIEDTLLDLANYAIMTVIWLKKHDLSS